MHAWVWFGVGVALAAMELIAPTGFFLIILGCAAICVGILVALGIMTSWIPQSIVFCIVALTLWLFLGKKLKTLFAAKQLRQGQLIGAVVRMTETVKPGDFGSGELWGAVWRIHNVDTGDLVAGRDGVVVGSEGITLQVKSK